MKIRLKWVLTSVLALAAAVIAAGYAILASFDSADLRAVIEEEAKKATGRSLAIGGDMDLAISWTPTIAIENVTFGNAAWGVWPELFSIRRLEVKVALLPLLSGEIEVRRLVAIEPSILLETNLDGQGNWIFAESAESAAGTEDAVPIPAFRRIEIRDGRVLYRNGRSDQEILVELEALNAAAASPSSPSVVDFRGKYNGVEISGAGRFASRDQLLSGKRIPLDLDLQLGPTALKLAGEIADLAAARGLALDLDMRGPKLADLGPIVGEDLPQLGPYSLTGQLRDTEQGLKIVGLAATLGNSDMAGNLNMIFSGPRPLFDATLNASALDLRDFLGRDPGPEAETQSPSPGQDAKPKRVFSAEPLPLDTLRAFDANIKINADQAQFDEKTMIADLAAEADLKAGLLTLRDLRGGFSGGNVAGGLSLDAAAGDAQLALALTAKNFNYGRFLLGRDITDGVDGTLDAEMDLRASGNSLHAWAKSMDGRIKLVGGKGRVRSDLLQAGGAGLIDMVSAWREAENDLALNCVVMVLPVKDGVMNAEAVLIDTEAVTVGVTGEVKLGEETLDLKVTPQAKQTSLMSLAVPVRVDGYLADPGVGPDALGTALGAAKIAGMFINPLAAGALIIMGSEMSNQNPCVAAIEAGAKSAAPSADSETESESEGLGEGITRGIRSIFND